MREIKQKVNPLFSSIIRGIYFCMGVIWEWVSYGKVYKWTLESMQRKRSRENRNKS